MSDRRHGCSRPPTALLALAVALAAVSWDRARAADTVEHLAGRLAAAASDAERERVLAADPTGLTPDLVRALVRAAARVRHTGPLADALPSLDFARELSLRVGDDLAFGDASNEIGSLRLAQARTGEARIAYQEALGACEAADLRACVATALIGLARAEGSRNAAERQALAERASAAAAASGDEGVRAAAALEQGRFHESRADYPRAEGFFRDALAVAERAGDEPRAAAAHVSLGRIHRLRSDTEPALRELTLGLEILRRIGHRGDAVAAANWIGVCHSMRSEFAVALSWFEEVLAEARALGLVSAIAPALNNIGIIHRRQGNLDLALDYFRRSLAASEEAEDTAATARTLNNIGLVQTGLEDYAAAIATYERALGLAEATGNKHEVANVLANIGVNHRMRGDYPRALEVYARALKMREDMGDRGGQAGVLRSVAIARLVQADHPGTVEAAMRSVALARETGLRDVVAGSLATAGEAYRALGQMERAREVLDESIAIAESMRAQVAGGAEPQQLFFETMQVAYWRMVDLKVAVGDAHAALTYAERGKGRVLLDALRGGQTRVFKDMTDPERAEERTLRERLGHLSEAAARERRREGAPAGPLARLEADLAGARLQLEAFEARLYAAHPELRVNRGQVADFAMEELGALLPDASTAIVEYAVSDRAVHVLVVTRDAPARPPLVKAYTLDLDRERARTLVRRFREQVTGRDLAVRGSARALYETLLAPAGEQLRGRTRLLLVPDDALWDLPFQALVDRRGRYLIEDAAISYAPSLTVLREIVARERARPRGRSQPTLLALGNPLPADEAVKRASLLTRGASFGPLPAAEDEVKALGRLYGSAASTVLTGARASEGVLKAEAPRFEVVHLAGHGILDSASPLRSHVLLAPGPGGEDGLLEADEIMNLSLHADLVVLSACETGRGRFTEGEGLIGLSWALFVAGAPTSVVSQWKVDSASTSAFMVALHRQLRASPRLAKAEALRAASRALLAKPAYRHPFYWAGFVMMGDAS